MLFGLHQLGVQPRLGLTDCFRRRQIHQNMMWCLACVWPACRCRLLLGCEGVLLASCEGVFLASCEGVLLASCEGVLLASAAFAMQARLYCTKWESFWCAACSCDVLTHRTKQVFY